MKTFYSKVLAYEGSHYDLGFWQGQEIKNSLIVSNRERQWALRSPKFAIELAEVKEAYNQFAPGLWEELCGLSEGAELPLEQVLRDYGGYRVPSPRGGCSTIVTSDYLVRNYDYHPRTYEGRYLLYKPTDHGYATIGPTQRIVGRMDGMNEHGLALAYNFMHRKQPGPGFICNAIGRIVLQTAKNTEEAISLLKEIPHRHSFTYIIVDASGNRKLIETTPRAVIVRDAHLCTNHFNVQQSENRRVLKESEARMSVLNEEWQADADVQASFNLLNDTKAGVFVEDYKSWSGTIHTTAYIPEKLEAWIALGGDQEPTVFSFKDWLEGKSLEVEQLTGEINTDLGFYHMDNIRR